MKKVIELNSLTVDYRVDKNTKVHALRDINLSVNKGETLAIVGESGCGKSTLANAMMRLLPDNAEINGTIRINGKDITALTNKELEKIRGFEAGMIFQEPGSSLNPVFTVKQQIEETINTHYKGMSDGEVKKAGLLLLKEVGLEDAERIYNAYPHQLSGGQQQRVMIAIALSCDPDLLIADEPTTALDVTVQAQIVKLLKGLKKKRKLTTILITHDLHLAVELAERIIVMYAGEIVEDGRIRDDKDAKHPYTKALFEIIPDIREKNREFKVIPGNVPELTEIFEHCYFANRCSKVIEKCSLAHPKMRKVGKSMVRCIRAK